MSALSEELFFWGKSKNKKHPHRREKHPGASVFWWYSTGECPDGNVSRYTREKYVMVLFQMWSLMSVYFLSNGAVGENPKCLKCFLFAKSQREVKINLKNRGSRGKCSKEEYFYNILQRKSTLLLNIFLLIPGFWDFLASFWLFVNTKHFKHFWFSPPAPLDKKYMEKRCFKSWSILCTKCQFWKAKCDRKDFYKIAFS